MSDSLVVYNNCSLGGVVSVMRERVKQGLSKGAHYDFYFFNDFGGRASLVEAGARHVMVGNMSHENNVATLVRNNGYKSAHLFSHYHLGHLLKLHKIRVHAEVHGSHISAIHDLRKAGSAYDRITVPSQWSKDWIAGHGFDPSIIDVVENSVDRSIFYERPDIELKGAKPAPVIWVGRMEEHKNWRDALSIFSILLKRGQPIQPVMVLSLHSDAARIHEFFRQLSLLGLLSKVEVLYNISQIEVAHLFREAAAMGGCSLLTSKLESFGLAVTESQYCGLPVVASRVGAIPERVTHDESVRLFDFGDNQVAADLIEQVICAN
ncbi:glycosyltransferase family 4 protein [Limimaricola sp. ASW11-118]|uniref:Glycosyltransferase family 4 protein n=1 Tax=Limimaricola litoreus TaxID=2955316 RepID=A0A9X2FSH9_9RHOB|nr:glycosyltransferase family 4 protein [Limimaricola litoreus]MCP1169435.1 glycosyltransferase family 4 protein [Limimaricola litoreus]